MVWVKLEDQIPHHPKFVAAGAVASWLWVCGNCHCNKYLTDGFIADTTLSSLGVVPQPKKHAETLIRVGLWERTDGGYQVHDFLEFNPSRADVLRDRDERHASKVAAGRAGGLAKAKQTASRNLADGKHPITKSARNRTKQNPSPVPTRPDPSRPLKAGESTRGKAFAGERLAIPAFLHEEFGNELGAEAEAFDLLDWYRRADEELVATGEKFDTLPWIRAKFRKDAQIPTPERPLAVRPRDVTPLRRWDEDCHHEPKCERYDWHQVKLERERQHA